MVVVSFESKEGLKRLAASHKLPFVFLLDPNKEVYRLFGMVYKEKGSIITWRTALAYIKLRLAGYPGQPRGKDVRQMGGDVIIDNRGVVRFIHRSHYPEELPKIPLLLKMLEELAPGNNKPI